MKRSLCTGRSMCNGEETERIQLLTQTAYWVKQQ
jgi:hypothetical protein